jgi:MarR family transcriptional regulator, organic hydroperoxide resistance regulator
LLAWLSISPATKSGLPKDTEDFTAAWGDFLAALRRSRARQSNDPTAPLTLSQYHLIAALESSPSLPVGRLAEAAGVSSPTATRMLDGLERDGLIERSPSEQDRRSVSVSLTEAGREAQRAERRRLERKRRALAEQLTPAERRQANALLRRLAALIDEL